MRSALATALRFGLGGRARPTGPRPPLELELYEFESCPYCRKVREALVWFDLDVTVFPCPPGGTRYREGRGPFPLLVDAGEPIRGSSAIVQHLARRCGDAPVPRALRLGPLTTATTALASALLPRVRALPAHLPAGPLELFADETSTAAREVRTLLCALELPYRWRTAGRGSSKLAELRDRTGADDLPVLLAGDLVLRGAGPIAAHLRRAHAG